MYCLTQPPVVRLSMSELRQIVLPNLGMSGTRDVVPSPRTASPIITHQTTEQAVSRDIVITSRVIDHVIDHVTRYFDCQYKIAPEMVSLKSFYPAPIVIIFVKPSTLSNLSSW